MSAGWEQNSCAPMQDDRRVGRFTSKRPLFWQCGHLPGLLGWSAACTKGSKENPQLKQVTWSTKSWCTCLSRLVTVPSKLTRLLLCEHLQTFHDRITEKNAMLFESWQLLLPFTQQSTEGRLYWRALFTSYAMYWHLFMACSLHTLCEQLTWGQRCWQSCQQPHSAPRCCCVYQRTWCNAAAQLPWQLGSKLAILPLDRHATTHRHAVSWCPPTFLPDSLASYAFDLH